MFSATFLGHQGWLFATETTHLLVDPLLTERFGHGGALGVVYPPRRIDPSAFPPVDGVVLTHEHDDHFDIPSLHRLDRRIPVWLSSRSSVAARDVLRAMGFVVHALEPDAELAVGDLRYRTFVADHAGGQHGDEWDVFPFLLHDTAGHGSFVSSVDVRPTARMLSTLRDLVPRAGIWCYANNTASAAAQNVTGAGPSAPEDGITLASVVLRRYAEVVRAWGEPVASLVCGAGWSFPGEREWMNRVAFGVASERLAAALAGARPGRLALAPAPGFTVTLRRGEIVQTRDSRAFIEALPRERWPERGDHGSRRRVDDYTPACGRARFPAGDRPELLHALDDFARHLYGTPVFAGLCSMAPSHGTLRTAFAFSLRTDEGPSRWVLRYEPSACAFVDDPATDPERELVSGLECWATDLLALLRGELGPTAICYAGRIRVWNHAPGEVRISPHDLWMFGHPLRRPAAAAALYRSLLAREPEVVPRVPARPTAR